MNKSSCLVIKTLCRNGLSRASSTLLYRTERFVYELPRVSNQAVIMKVGDVDGGGPPGSS